jgi:alkylation response protein AidB-like acyl-CoA dehydrogenase
LFGGLGLTKGGQGERVERLWRDCKIAAIPGGSEEVLLDLAMRQQIKIQRKKGAKI